jgi:hypothetical protein
MLHLPLEHRPAVQVTLTLTTASQNTKPATSGLPFVGAAAAAVWGRLRELLWAK